MKCLVTKLKEIVDNPMLCRVGEIKMESLGLPVIDTDVLEDEHSYSTISKWTASDSENPEAIKDCLFTSRWGNFRANGKDNIFVHRTPVDITTPRGAIVTIPNKYELSSLSISTYIFGDLEKVSGCKFSRFFSRTPKGVNAVWGDLSSFNGNPRLELIYITSPNLYGLEGLTDCPILTDFIITRCKNYLGDIEQFAKFAKIKNINVSEVSLSGKVENLLNKLHSEGRVSGTLFINSNSYPSTTLLTLNGEPFTLGTFTFSSEGWSKNS